MAGKPAAIFNSFRFTITPVLIRYAARAYRSSFIIEAKDMRVWVVKF